MKRVFLAGVALAALMSAAVAADIPRRVVEQRDGESAYDALRRELS